MLAFGADRLAEFKRNFSEIAEAFIKSTTILCCQFCQSLVARRFSF
jgi:hypothetical protein